MKAIEVQAIEPYLDEYGNTIVVEDPSYLVDLVGRVIFRGSYNTLVIKKGARIKNLSAAFDGNHGVFVIGANTNVPASSWTFRVGEISSISIGEDVSTTSVCKLTAVEGSHLTVGDDCMIAAGCEIRADDNHAIFDVATGDRVNLSANVTLRPHVWLAKNVTVLSGVEIGEGSVIGTGAIVTKNVPNNAIAAGNPARVVKKNVAWERSHLSLHEPPFRPHRDSVEVETPQYWNFTEEPTC